MDTKSSKKKVGVEEHNHKIMMESMNAPAFCNFCRRVTETKEWDCKVCGFSKPHPEGLK